MKDILLTTFPAHRSGNVGDQLITFSLLKMFRSRFPAYDPIIRFREESLDDIDPEAIKSIVAPGFSVVDGTYPNLFSLYSDVRRLRNFFPIGCSFQGIRPDESTFAGHQYSSETKEFLSSVVENIGPLMCRDELIVKMLLGNGIAAEYFGDLAIYDEEKVGSEFIAPNSISSLVFTIQHHDKYDEQSFSVLQMLSKKFANATRYVAYHSRPNRRSKKVAEFAVSLGFIPKELSGDVNNLSFYDDIDLHVGYRLHGHIYFLRRRKPSVLLVEDARSFGFSRTRGTSYGCLDVMDVELDEVGKTTAEEIEVFLDRQISTRFSEYQEVFDFIDSKYKGVVAPYIDMFARKYLVSY
ncbi:Polysaccharide pyruvyl transferase [Bordetella trematum]|uniref:Polysaccharide pyruvyl transferase n=1 Tax=Bordetella trematum TaxID=123899 RepID=A0A157QTX2_9BORD|nr:polysaccharide pyruvyl transferase family protein [Bordetella trematum]NNH18168.1 polysaccharide pyruvyl transferase family protein [Bordetella trematum]SAI49157.1 Polysaccharide pyruvyl transferase [Bordetella trematum]SAI66950.1 Polysaccharide pyruvyl transferase [Bordetella trematum]SUV96360.1 Polysaccharide pyruvyl transferase [Bordetella trematum]